MLGIGLMLGFCALAPLGDGIAKAVGPVIPLAQVLFVRFAVQALTLSPALAGAHRQALTTRIWAWTAVRTGLHILGIGAMFLSLRYLPIADAIAIAFVMPFILLLLGRYLLGEEVGWRRMTACVFGFAGTLLVIQPSFVRVGSAALLPLAVAVSFALFMLVTRRIAKDIDPVPLQAASGLLATAVLVVLLCIGAVTEVRELGWVRPNGIQAAALLSLGAIGTVAHLMMSAALRFAPSATLAPMQYLEIPIATLYGWLLFREVPNGLAALGIAFTICAGLYIIARERRLAKALEVKISSPRPREPSRM